MKENKRTHYREQDYDAVTNQSRWAASRYNNQSSTYSLKCSLSLSAGASPSEVIRRRYVRLALYPRSIRQSSTHLISRSVTGVVAHASGRSLRSTAISSSISLSLDPPAPPPSPIVTYVAEPNPVHLRARRLHVLRSPSV